MLVRELDLSVQVHGWSRLEVVAGGLPLSADAQSTQHWCHFIVMPQRDNEYSDPSVSKVQPHTCHCLSQPPNVSATAEGDPSTILDAQRTEVSLF